MASQTCLHSRWVFKYENPEWFQMDVTRGDLVEAGGSAHRPPPCGSRRSAYCASGQWMTKERAHLRSDGQAEWTSLEERAVWASNRPLWLSLRLFVLRENPDRCPLSSEDGKTRSGQQRRDDHQPPLRTLQSAGRSIQRAPQWRGEPGAVDPQSLRRGQAAEGRGGSSWRRSQEAPAQTQPKTPLRGDGDPGQRHLRQGEESGGESKPEDSESLSLSLSACVRACVRVCVCRRYPEQILFVFCVAKLRCL